jgi:putative ABC transport system permease protein
LAGIAILLWFVAIGIVGSIMYLSALERLTDFAVFRAMGMAARHLFSTLMFEAVALTMAAALLAVGMASLLAPLFSLGVEIPTSAYLRLPALAVAIGVVASGIALRRAVTVDPALAFAGA